MNIDLYSVFITSAYSVGIIFWFFVWKYINGFALLKEIKLMYIPLLFIPFVFILEIIFYFYHPVFGDFDAEEHFLKVIEGNNAQLITSTFGMIILAATLLNFKAIKRLPREFLLFASFALMFSVGGVLVLYWLPIERADLYFLLRHFKTIPYTYSIGFFMGCLLIILDKMLLIKIVKKH